MRGWLQRERGALACVAAAGLLRALCVWATRDDPVFRVPYLDEAFYHTWARSLAEGGGDFQGPYFLGPLYPHVLSWLYRVFGADPFVARVFQSLLGVLDVGLVLVVARRLGGRVAGYAAAGLFALHGCLVFHEGLLVLEPLLLTLLLAASAALLLPAREERARGGRDQARPRGEAQPNRGSSGRMGPSAWAAFAGALLGLATLARATAFLVAPVVAAALARGPQRWRRLLCCAVLWGAVVAPVVLRNHQLGGGFVVTTNAGVNFYAGNFPRAKGRFHEPSGVHFFTSPNVLPEGATLPTAVAPRPLTIEALAGTATAADSKLWFARAREWIRKEPGAFLALLCRRAALTLQGREIAQLESYSFHRARLMALRFFPVDLTWILPLAALGIWQARRSAGTALVLHFAVATLLPCVLFFVTARHRLVALPYLAILAGCGAAALASLATSRRWSRLALAGLGLAAAAALTRVAAQPPPTATGWESAQMAERVYAWGDLDGAIRWQEAALVGLPRRPDVALNLALYRSERGQPQDLERAENMLRALVEGAPVETRFLDALGTVLVQRGRPAEARATWERALRVDPGFAPAREHLRALDASGTSPVAPDSP